HEPPVKREPGEPGEGFFGPPRGPLVPPGTYTITVSVGSASDSKSVIVQEDPRVQISDADRRAWYEAARRGAGLWTRADAINRSAASLKKQLGDLQQAAAKREPRPPEAVTSAVKAAAEKADALAARMSRQAPLGFAGAPLEDEPDPLLARARGVYLAVGSMSAPPTPQQQQVLDEVAREIDDAAKPAGVRHPRASTSALLLPAPVGGLMASRAWRGPPPAAALRMGSPRHGAGRRRPPSAAGSPGPPRPGR